MALVTTTEVAAIIDVSGDYDLTPFILAADALMTQLDLEGKGLSDALLKEIQRWLAAHFAAQLEKRYASEKTGDAATAYQYKIDLRLQDTMYGQQAIILDTSGTLRNLNDKGSAGGPLVEATVND